nr:MAG TPA: hypothetical protein [Caudoviricetes sp.]
MYILPRVKTFECVSFYTSIKKAYGKPWKSRETEKY